MLFRTQPGMQVKVGQWMHIRHQLMFPQGLGWLSKCVSVQVDFPERAGALKRFLAVLCPAFGLTLFHYRKTGASEP